MADLHLTEAEPTAGERAAIDQALAGRDGGGAVIVADERLVRGGEARRRELRHLLLPGLWALQTEAGWISPGGLNALCERLGVPPAEAYGVATFYDLFVTDAAPDPVEAGVDGRTHWVCTDVACRLGAEHEARRAELVAEGRRVEESPCLGQCERDGAAVYIQSRGGEPDEDPGHVPDPPVPQMGEPQLRILSRVGRVDPTSLESYVGFGGYRALTEAFLLGPDGVIGALTSAGLSGRGGAAFPTGVKWRAVRDAGGDTAHVVVNADESETGTFKDRVLMEHDPFALVEAATIAGFAVGAAKGWIYIRGEYPVATARVQAAIDAARDAGFLGERIGRSSFSFDLEIRRGAGAYICGEETALFNSIEGFRGEPRQKPPFPTTDGLFSAPTAANNVETLHNVLAILRNGAEAYRAVGTAESPGTRLFCVSGHVARPGVYEHPFGVRLGTVLDAAGGVTGELRAVLLGGAAGAFVAAGSLDLELSLEATREAGSTLGSGVVLVMNSTVDLTDVCRRIAEFFRHESCGQCVPCRVGVVRQHEQLVDLGAGRPVDWALHDEIRRAMADASICGLGHTAATAIASARDLGLIGEGS